MVVLTASWQRLGRILKAPGRADQERGASMVEYALLVALIAVVCIVALSLLGKNAASTFNSVGSSIGG